MSSEDSSSKIGSNWKGYVFSKPDVVLRYCPELNSWWITVIDSNDSEFIGELDEDLDNRDFADNGFLYKRIWSINVDDEKKALNIFRALSNLFKSFPKKNYEIVKSR